MRKLGLLFGGSCFVVTMLALCAFIVFATIRGAAALADYGPNAFMAVCTSLIQFFGGALLFMLAITCAIETGVWVRERMAEDDWGD